MAAQAVEGFWGLGVSRGEVRTAALVAVALGVLLGSTWVSRLQSTFGWDALLPLARVVALACLVVLALYYRTRPFNGRHVLALAGASLAVHALCVVLSTALGRPEELLALGCASALFEGICLAAVELLLLTRAATALPPKWTGVAVAAGFLVGNLYDTLFLSAPTAVITVQWVVAKAVALALAALLVPGRPAHTVTLERPSGVGRPALRGGASGSTGVAEAHGAGGAPAGTASPGDPAGNRPSAPRETAAGLPAATPSPDAPFAMRHLAPVAALVVALMLVQGVFSQVTGLGGVGERAFYGLSSGIAVFVVRVLTLAYCAARDRDVPFAEPVCLCALAWVGALGLIALTWEGDGGAPGALLLEAGYSVLQVLPLIAVLQQANRSPRHAVTAAGIAAAVSFANQPSRFVATLLFDRSTLGAPGVAALAYASTVLVAAFVVALLTAVLRAGGHRGRAVPQVGTDAQTALLAELDDPVVRSEIAFCRRFEAVCREKGVTPREREVLFEAVHGYTIDNIAERLSLSRETVKANLSKSYARAGVSGKQGFLQLMDERADAAEAETAPAKTAGR